MNILNIKYISENSKENNQIFTQKIESILQDVKTDIKNLPYFKSLVNEVIKNVREYEDEMTNKINDLSNSLLVSKTKMERVQKENMELIYLKDQKLQLYNNEKLENIINRKKVEDLRSELQNLQSNFDKNLNENNQIKLLLNKLHTEKLESYHQSSIVNLKIEEKKGKKDFKDEYEKEKIKNLELFQKYEDSIILIEKYKSSLAEIYPEYQRYIEIEIKLQSENKILKNNFQQISNDYDQCKLILSKMHLEYGSIKEESLDLKNRFDEIKYKLESTNILLENKNNIIDNYEKRLKKIETIENQVQKNNNNEMNILKCKLNQLTEHNVFLLEKINKYNENNNQLSIDKEKLIKIIESFKTNYNHTTSGRTECDCRNELETLKNKFKLEMDSLIKEKCDLIRQIQSLKNEPIKTKCETVYNFMSYNYLSDLNEVTSDLQKKESLHKLLLETKEREINSLKDINFKLSQELANLKNIVYYLEHIEKISNSNQISSQMEIIKNKVKISSQDVNKIESDTDKLKLLMDYNEISKKLQIAELSKEKIQLMLVNNEERNNQLKTDLDKLKIENKLKDKELCELRENIAETNKKLEKNERDLKKLNELLIKYSHKI